MKTNAIHSVLSVTSESGQLQYSRLTSQLTKDAQRVYEGGVIIDWQIDSLEMIGGHPVTVMGNPQLIDGQTGRAVWFDGRQDGLLIPVNPLGGLSAYTVEVVFRPEPDGEDEQRLFHAGLTDDDRFLFETRPSGTVGWALDSFVASGEIGIPLLDTSISHPIGDWYVVSAIVGGGRFASFVNGVRELEASVTFGIPTAGQTSLGVRQNRVSWFRGAIAQVRITDAVLEPRQMLTVGRP